MAWGKGIYWFIVTGLWVDRLDENSEQIGKTGQLWYNNLQIRDAGLNNKVYA